MTTNGTASAPVEPTTTDTPPPEPDGVGPVPHAGNGRLNAGPSYTEPELSYFKQGIFCALDADSRHSFATVFEELGASKRAALASEAQVGELKTRTLDAEIEEAERSLREMVEPPPGDDPITIETKLAQGTRLDERIAKTRAVLYENKRTLAEARRRQLPDVLAEQVKVAFEETDRVLDHALRLSEKRREIAEKDFETSRDALQERAERLRATSERVEASLQPLIEMQDRLHRSGLTAAIAVLLEWAGTAGLFVAGWSFSAFTARGALGSTDYVSFFAGRMFSALDATFKNHDAPSWLFAAYVAAWTALIATVWAVSWLTERALTLRRDSSALLPEEIVRALTGIRRPMFPPWLRVTPFVFVAGLIVLLLAFFGPQGSDLENLLSSLSGQPVGIALALMTTGAFVVFLGTVVEPRFRSGDRLSQGWRDHVEAVGALASPYIVGAVTILWVTFAPYKESAALPILWFFSALLLTSATLGYGMWLHGIHAAVAGAQQYLRQLAQRREECLRPREFDKTSIDDQAFRTAWVERHRRLIETLAVWEQVPGAPSQRRWWFGSSTAPDFDAFDRTYLPDAWQRVADLEKDLERLEQQRDARDGGGGADVADEPTPKSLRESIARLRRERTELVTAVQRAQESVRADFLRRENALRDGFNCGQCYTHVDEAGLFGDIDG